MRFLDCTLRDGGYYNSWDFSEDLVHQYLEAMQAAGVNVVEMGFRSLVSSGFHGACAYSTDAYLASLPLPADLDVGVMINGSELVGEVPQQEALQRLFPTDASESPVDLVRIASHVHEFERVLPAVAWLRERGYQVGMNLMQIASCNEQEVRNLARLAVRYPPDVLYFADSMGSMKPGQVSKITRWLGSEWQGAIGIHTHDNMGLALSNTLRALDEGVTWFDATVSGMGRGPGNARTEEMAIEIAERRGKDANLVPLLALVRQHFRPMQEHFGWGTNSFYYLAGKYGIHPTYIQEMLNDARYNEEDVLAIIAHLRQEGGRKFSLGKLEAARQFYSGPPTGRWEPESIFEGRDVLLLGSGPGVARHRRALEGFIVRHEPLVLALNTQSAIESELIDVRAACHPVRLLADCSIHTRLPQPLITPYSMLPDDVRASLTGKQVYDFGLHIQPYTFSFNRTYCTTPASLVVAYALAVATSGKANRLYLAGFDGFAADDPRTGEMHSILELYQQEDRALQLQAITPTRFNLETTSVYAL